MKDRIFIQSISRMTYLKMFLVLNGPVCVIYILSLLRGDNSSLLNLFIVLIGLSGPIFGLMKWMYPRKEVLKIENNRFYLLHKGIWIEILHPSKNILIYRHYIKVLIEKKIITVHFGDSEILDLKIVVDSSIKNIV